MKEVGTANKGADRQTEVRTSGVLSRRGTIETVNHEVN